MRSADRIAVLREGQIVEIGNHEELMAAKGAYYSLVNDQQFVTVGHKSEAASA